MIAIILLILGTTILLLIVPKYIVSDRMQSIPFRSSFNQQNCKLDKSCWVHNKEMINRSYPKLSRNYVINRNQFEGPELPKMFFDQNFGKNIIT
jgi:hypothetical protein